MKASQTRRRDTIATPPRDAGTAYRLGAGALRVPAGGGSPAKQEDCPQCGRRRSQWRENLGRGCPGDDGELYCSQRCAGIIDRPDR